LGTSSLIQVLKLGHIGFGIEVATLHNLRQFAAAFIFRDGPGSIGREAPIHLLLVGLSVIAVVTGAIEKDASLNPDFGAAFFFGRIIRRFVWHAFINQCAFLSGTALRPRKLNWRKPGIFLIQGIAQHRLIGNVISGTKHGLSFLLTARHHLAGTGYIQRGGGIPF